MIGSNGRRVLDLKSLCFSVALGALCPALLGPTLMAQDKLQRELEFVRGLAREMRFVELARSEAERLATEFRDAADQDRIAQLAVEITYTVPARRATGSSSARCSRRRSNRASS